MHKVFGYITLAIEGEKNKELYKQTEVDCIHFMDIFGEIKSVGYNF